MPKNFRQEVVRNTLNASERRNHKHIERIYRKLGLNKRRRKVKRRIPNPDKEYLLQPIASNITWSMDFMSDVLENGRKIRILNVIDDYNREALMCEIDYSFPSEKVVKLVQRLIEWYGKPTNIHTDNGTEFIAKALKSFCDELLDAAYPNPERKTHAERIL